MKIALSPAEIAAFRNFLNCFEDAEQLSEREFVVDLYDAQPPISMDLTLQKDGVEIEGAAKLEFDDELDGWFLDQRVEDAALVERMLQSAMQ